MDDRLSGSSALVTDMDRRISLAIIRALGKAGVRVVGISHQPLPVGSFSKYCRKVYRVRDYRSVPDLFLKELEQVARAEKPDVLYAIQEEVIMICSKNRRLWNTHTKALIPEITALERACDKWETIRIAKKLGIPVPDTFCPENPEEAGLIAKKWHGEAVIKPRRSSGSRGLVYVKDPSDLPAAYQRVSARFPRPLIQDRIPPEGSGLGVFALINEDKQVVAVFGHKRLRQYPVSGGPSTLCVSYQDDELIAQSISLFKEIGLVGVAMAEYKVDVRTGLPVLMEINPRFWGSLQLAVYAGVNFPVLYHKAAMGLPFDPVLEYPQNKYWRWLIPGDILHFLGNRNRFRLEPSFFKLNLANTDYDCQINDPLPAVGMLTTAILKIISGER